MPSQTIASQGRLIIGAMSGTSTADGVDVALVSIVGHGLSMSVSLVSHHTSNYPDSLRGRIINLRAAGKATLREIAQIGHGVTQAYVEAIRAALSGVSLAASDLAAIAAHGQTLFHDPPLTIQEFDPSLLSTELSCTVISDFRRADLAAGGQGAPLVPFADYLLFRDADRNRAIVNIGGIANVTLLPAGARPEDVIAFDTGPGNCVSDHLVRIRRDSVPLRAGDEGARREEVQNCDAGGAIASRGTVDDALLARLEQDAYFHRRPPKSTDGPAMIAIFESALREMPKERPLETLLATSARWTADLIADAIAPGAEVFVAGGGVHNAAIMAGLSARHPDVRRTDDLGIPSAAREAMAFAILGAATLDGIPANLPSVTGANRSAVLGSITRTQPSETGT